MTSADQSTLPKRAALNKPTVREMIMLEFPTQAKVSPGGDYVAFTLRTTHWRENVYEQICMLCDVANGRTHPLTRTGSVEQVEWVDDNTLALLRSGPDDDDKAQIWLCEGLVGEGWAVTEQKTGVEWFKPFGGGFVYKATHPEDDEEKKRTGNFGKYTHFEQEKSASALYYVGLAEMKQHRAAQRALPKDEGEKLVAPVVELSRLLPKPLSIQVVVPSPRNDALYLTCWPHDDLIYFRETTTYCITLDAQTCLSVYLQREEAKQADKDPNTDETEDLSYLGELTPLHLPAGAHMAGISPDGGRLLVYHRGRDEKMYTHEDLWIIGTPAAREVANAAAFLASMSNITEGLDRQVMEPQWVEDGIFGVYPDGTVMQPVRLGEDGQATTLEIGGLFPEYGFHVNDAGSISFVGTNAATFYEVYLVTHDDNESWTPVQLTDYSSALDGWEVGTVESIRWTSVDGTEIEGVLRKPADFDPNRRYPLVFVVHGGPQWFSPSYLIYYDDVTNYPTIQFANKDVLVLKPNYRGSLGRGQAFADLNVNNLGVGDLWDIESAIEYLVDLGWVDPERIGCMGWSQGGYISAYAGLHSSKFAAVSVGAGVSDWYTYHISNDIPDFTVDYLSDSPFRKRDLYDKTAPMSNITAADTPMLIQHGADDRRVPISNAMELYRGLKEMGVPVELFVYPNFGHPITKPRENHAVMHQNLTWFSHYLLGEELELE